MPRFEDAARHDMFRVSCFSLVDPAPVATELPLPVLAIQADCTELF
jgi:hypothetical protein